MKSFLSFPILTFAAVCTLIVGLLINHQFLFHVQSSDQEAYWSLLEQTDPKYAKNTASPYKAKQQRTNLNKNMWRTSSGEHLQLSIRSEEAELVLDHHDETTEVIEHMHNVKCFMQEELYYVFPDGSEAVLNPQGGLILREETNADSTNFLVNEGLDIQPMQIMRYIEAENASFHYKDDRLIAYQVTISRFAIPGHELVDSIENITPIMTGVAESVEFKLSGEDPQFTAHKLKATLHNTK